MLKLNLSNTMKLKSVNFLSSTNRLWQLPIFFFILFSCSSELLQSEQEHSRVTSQNLIRQLRYAEFKNEAPNVFEKLKFKSLKNSKDTENSKIFVINGFSIDAEYVYISEQDNGKKTYTFYLEKEERSSYLENYVLNEQDNGIFDAYMIRYDSIIANHQSQIAKEDVGKHVKLEYLGQLRDNSTVERAMYCPQVAFQQYVYVPGVCSSEEHHETGQSGCLCGTPGHMGCTPADAGFYIVQYVMLPAECGGGASPGNGPGPSPISTGPYNPGGGFGSTANPCDKIKNPLGRNVINSTPPTTVKGMLQNLKDNLPSANPQITGEISYAMFQNSNNELEAEFFAETTQEHNIELSLQAGLYPVYMHTHKVNGLTIFSLADIFAIKQGIDNGNFNENTVFYLVTDNGTQYAMTITDLNSFTAWANLYFVGWEFDNIKEKKEETYAESVDIKNTIEQNENGLVSFFDSKLVGIQLFKASSDFTSWQKLTYDFITQKTIKTNCPN